MSKIEQLTTAMSNAYKAGDFDTAFESASQIVAQDSNHLDAWRHVARIATNRKQLDEAKNAWSKISDLEPGETEPYLQLARMARADGDNDLCVKHCDSYLTFVTDNPEVLTMRVEALLKEKRAHLVEAAFADLCAVETKNAGRLARIAVNYGMGAEIAGTLSMLAAAGNADAIAHCDTLFRSERDAAIGFEIQKNSFSAAQCYRTMRRLRPDADYSQTNLARLRRPYIERARRAYKKGEYERAIEHAHSCTKIDSQEAEPYIIAGRSLSAMDKTAEALDAFTRGIENCSFDGWLMVNFARASASLGNFLDAARAYAEVVSATDEKSQNYYGEANTQFGRLVLQLEQQALSDANDGNIASALDSLDYMAATGNVSESFERSCANAFNLGQRVLRIAFEERSEAALPLANRLIQFDGTKPYPLRVAGRVLLEARKHADSLPYWNALVEMEPDTAEFWLLKARCHRVLGQSNDARQAAETLLRLDPDHAEGSQIAAVA